MGIRRRQAIAAIATAPAALAATTAIAADEEEMVEYLFVQNASNVNLANDELRLGNVAQETLYFSDRPERIVGRVTTAEFVDH